ncbi:MAG: SDR family oxidoreductase [Planctomycetes bacterium]|nr:SDR family oxidoreductase [Planctomycetota bacterium]
MDDGPVTIVTGAGSGVGREVCLMLAGAGHRLTLVGRTETRLEETLASIARTAAAPAATLVLPADITDAEQARSVIDVTHQQWGRVDALVNNAGVAPLVPIADTDEDLLFRTFAVNAFGAAYLIARAWPIFLRQRAGCIVNVSSQAAWDPFPGFFAYGAAKAALESFTRSALNEGRDHGIRPFNIAPGAIETEMLRKLIPEEQLPRDRTLAPGDVARVICDCILGRRDAEIGTTIRLSSP